MAATRDGLVHHGAAGLRDPQAGAAMATDSVGWVASMTKALTAVAALQLVEQGKLTLDAPIADILPELAAPMVLEGFDNAGAPILRPASQPLTLRRLLTHTSGYGYNTWSADLDRFLRQAATPRIPTNTAELAAYPLLFDPGAGWTYGIGIDVVGRAIEIVTGKRLDACLAAAITDRLGMTDTMFVPGPDQISRRVVMQARLPDGGMRPIDGPMAISLPFLAGGGGLCSTASDYLKFLQALLHGGAPLLGPAMFGELMRNQIGDLPVSPMRSAMPSASNDVDLYPGMAKQWTLGFLRTTETTPEGRSAGSLAWAGLSNCYYWLDPARGVCGVFIAGLLPFADTRALAAFAAYESAIYRMLDDPNGPAH